jgi:hypothetical protein
VFNAEESNNSNKGGGGAGAGFLDINEYLNKLDLLI